jgi:hypothetical protein
MAGPRHQLERLLARDDAVGEARVPEVVERADVLGDLRRVERLPELDRVRFVVDPRAALRVGEHELVLTFECGRAPMLPERLGEQGRERDRPFTSSDFDSTTLSTEPIRSTSRHRSPRSSSRRMPVSMRLRKISCA